MVYVRLDEDWTDGDGNDHAAGEIVDVDAGTLAELEAQGTVGSTKENTAWTNAKAGTSESWARQSGERHGDNWGRPPGPDNDEDEW